MKRMSRVYLKKRGRADWLPLSVEGTKPQLELDTQRERQLPWLRSRSVAGELTRSAAAVDESGCFDARRAAAAATGVSGADQVEGIEGIYAELREEAFIDGEVLLQRQVGIEVVRSEYAVAASRSDLVKPGAGEPPVGLEAVAPVLAR